MPLPEETIDLRLERWPVARLATATDAGRPHQVPIVFARAGGRLWSPIDGKPKRGGELARLRHLRAHPEVSLLLDEYDADWTRLWWIRIDAVAEVVAVGDGDRSVTDGEGREAVAEAVAALEAKYPQYAEVPVLREPATLVAFEPVRIVSWAAGG